MFDPGYFGEKLTYTNGGVLPHRLSGLIVVGLPGIQRKSEEAHAAEPTWQETLAQCQARKISRRELTYYRPEEVTVAANASAAHILLTHDWPADPNKDEAYPPRVEQSIATATRPMFHFCGHHHRSGAFATAGTKVRALNAIGNNADQNRLEPGRAWPRHLGRRNPSRDRLLASGKQQGLFGSSALASEPSTTQIRIASQVHSGGNFNSKSS